MTRSRPTMAAADDARMRLMCSHGGRLVPCAREVAFRDLAARLAEMAGAPAVSALRHHLADEDPNDGVLVSVTCDEELAHMRDEYDRLRATRPAAAFRVLVVSTASGEDGAQQPRRTASFGLPPLPPVPPMMRRVQSEQAILARAHLHRRAAAAPAPVRRVQSAQELAASRSRPPLHHQQSGGCSCHRPGVCAPAPPPARAICKNVNGVRPGWQQPAPPASAARSRDAEVAVEKGRAIWEFE
ncbi:hypothetical protein ACP70R_012146 [Stipagrostis hirtigluma subsp. patula]